MENKQINEELTPEQLEARRDEMKQFYENSLPYLEAQAKYEKLLTEVPDLHLMGDGGSSDGSNWLEIELNQSIPLVSMLKQMPPVKKVASHGNNIIVALKPS